MRWLRCDIMIVQWSILNSYGVPVALPQICCNDVYGKFGLADSCGATGICLPMSGFASLAAAAWWVIVDSYLGGFGVQNPWNLGACSLRPLVSMGFRVSLRRDASI